MSIMEPPHIDEDEPFVADQPVNSALAEVRAEVRRQGRSIRSTQQAFSIFAVLALLISGATLLGVAFKLQKKTEKVVVRTPSAVAVKRVGAPLPRNVDVTLAQFAVTPSVPKAAAGRVTFRAHNAGTITHEFVVIKTNKLAADLPIVKGRASEANNIGETGDVKPGQTKSVTIKLAAGHYALICNLPGHYLAGQHTDFNVQ